jgi:hypothetical protein
MTDDERRAQAQESLRAAGLRPIPEDPVEDAVALALHKALQEARRMLSERPDLTSGKPLLYREAVVHILGAILALPAADRAYAHSAALSALFFEPDDDPDA